MFLTVTILAHTVSSLDMYTCNISNVRKSVSLGYPDIEMRVESMTCSRVFLMKFEMLDSR